jgi:glycosyltransferase involved in cell wall biosynthesis
MPVHNNAREIARALAAAQAARAHLKEIIVVDDASTDGSAEVAEHFGVRVERLPEHSGAPAARNHGVRCASGDVIFFLDADIVAPESAIARAAVLLDEHPEYDAAFGSYDDDPDVPTTLSRFRNLLHHYTHQTGNREATTFWTGCGLVRKTAFESVGGFDDAWRGVEDIEFGHRLRVSGHRILLDPTLQVKHLKRWTFSSMVWTDLRYRAFLWSRLLLAQEALPDDLNVRTAQRVSVALSLLVIALLPLLLLDARWLWAIAAGAAAIVAINRDFHALLMRRGGLGFALACIPLHIVYFVCAGLGFALALLERRILR